MVYRKPSNTFNHLFLLKHTHFFFKLGTEKQRLHSLNREREKRESGQHTQATMEKVSGQHQHQMVEVNSHGGSRNNHLHHKKKRKKKLFSTRVLLSLFHELLQPNKQTCVFFGTVINISDRIRFVRRNKI
ncbi:hypothetical protein Hanom_Chr08g00714941 [Helianthus anomalus]